MWAARRIVGAPPVSRSFTWEPRMNLGHLTYVQEGIPATPGASGWPGSPPLEARGAACSTKLATLAWLPHH